MLALSIALADSAIFRATGRSNSVVLLRRLLTRVSRDRLGGRRRPRRLVSRQARAGRLAEWQCHDVSGLVVLRLTGTDGTGSLAGQFMDHAGVLAPDLPAPGCPDVADCRAWRPARNGVSREFDWAWDVRGDRVLGDPDNSRRSRSLLRFRHDGIGVCDARAVSRRRVPPKSNRRTVARGG